MSAFTDGVVYKYNAHTQSHGKWPQYGTPMGYPETRISVEIVSFSPISLEVLASLIQAVGNWIAARALKEALKGKEEECERLVKVFRKKIATFEEMHSFNYHCEISTLTRKVFNLNRLLEILQAQEKEEK